jgi:iron complex outermembrane receptor protein
MECTSWKFLTDSSLWRVRENSLVCGLRFILLPIQVLVFSTTLSASDSVNESIVDFNIPPQALSSALIEFAEQANLTLIFPDQLVQGKLSKAVSGLSMPRTAISQILVGTGLAPDFSRHNFYTIKILREGEGMKSKNKIGLVGAFAAAVAGSTMVHGQEKKGISIDEVIVTGSNVQRSGFEAISPVQVMNREQMLAEGAKTITDFAINLPANIGSEFQSESGSLIGTAQFNLRGLGLGSTLTLINGRRGGVSAVADGGGNQFFDINQLPVSMIERVDFLTDGASAVYGSQAVAGVANIVTRKNFEGFEFTVDTQSSGGPGIDQHQIGFAFGSSGDSATKVNIYGGYTTRNRADRSDFDFINERVLGNGDPTASKTLSAFGSPGTYRAVNDLGTAGTGSNYPDPDCEAAGGILKAPFCRFSFADQVSVIPEESRIQLFSEATHDFNDNIKAFVETSYSSNKISRTLGPYLFKHGTLTSGRMFIPGDHPFNFFTDDSDGGLDYIGPDNWDGSVHQGADLELRGRPFGDEYNGGRGPADLEIDLSYMRMLGGITADLSDQWSVEASYMFARSDRDETRPFNYISSVVNSRLLDGSWNPFGTRLANPTLVSPKDGVSIAANSDDVSDSLHTLNINGSTADQEVLEVKFVGEVGALAGGGIGVAAGMQHRSESFSYSPDPLDVSGLGNGPDAPITGGQDVDAVFVEAMFPVSDSVTVQAAVRYEDYGTVDTTDPKLAVRWQATENFGVRGSWGTSFQAPSVRQMSVSSQSSIIDDPASLNPGTGQLECVNRDVTNIAIVTTQGGDSLKPQSADSLTFGFVMDWKGADISLDYWNFDYDDLITSDEGAQAILQNDCQDGTPDDARVRRRADGTVAEITSEFVNTGSVKTDGIDVSVAYTIDSFSYFDAINLSLGATYVNKFEVQTDSDSAKFDGAGSRNFSNQFRSMPKLRGNLGVKFEKGVHTLSTQLRYIDGYENDQSDTQIDSFLTLDGQYSIQLFQDRTRFSMGVKNLLDEEPPTLGENVRPGYDNVIHNVLGRTLYMSLTQSF